MSRARLQVAILRLTDGGNRREGPVWESLCHFRLSSGACFNVEERGEVRKEKVQLGSGLFEASPPPITPVLAVWLCEFKSSYASPLSAPRTASRRPSGTRKYGLFRCGCCGERTRRRCNTPGHAEPTTLYGASAVRGHRPSSSAASQRNQHFCTNSADSMKSSLFRLVVCPWCRGSSTI